MMGYWVSLILITIFLVFSLSGNLATGIFFGELSVSTPYSLELSDLSDLLSSSRSLYSDAPTFLPFLAFIIIYFIVCKMYYYITLFFF